MAVASPLSRLGWPIAAAVALAFLVGLALHGRRPDPMVQYKPAGLMTAIAPEEASGIEVALGGQKRLFERRDGKWDAKSAFAEQIDVALRLLRNSKPLRVMSPEEVARVPASEYALGPDSLSIRIRGTGGSFAIRFGAANPLGSARYAEVEGQPGVALLPVHVFDAWQQVIGGGR